MLGRGLATGSLTILLALAGTAAARGQDEGQAPDARSEHAPEAGPDVQTSMSAAVDLGLGEPEPGSACRPQC